jgi:hypothetical protein
MERKKRRKRKGGGSLTNTVKDIAATTFLVGGVAGGIKAV